MREEFVIGKPQPRRRRRGNIAGFLRFMDCVSACPNESMSGSLTAA